MTQFNYKDLTDQDIFDIAVNGVLKQNCQSRIGNRCVYRGRNNTKCAVGHIILDKDYNPDMDSTTIKNTSAEAIIRNTTELHDLVLHIDLIKDLQYWHDNLEEMLKKEFKMHAIDMLEYTVLQHHPNLHIKNIKSA